MNETNSDLLSWLIVFCVSGLIVLRIIASGQNDKEEVVRKCIPGKPHKEEKVILYCNDNHRWEVWGTFERVLENLFYGSYLCPTCKKRAKGLEVNG